MTWAEVTLLVAAALGLLIWFVWVVASRLDRLHRKVGASRAALENQLVRRATCVAELAWSGLLDPPSAVLMGEASWAALRAGGYGRAELLSAMPELSATIGSQAAGEADAIDRDVAESELSRTVREVLSDPDDVAAIHRDPSGTELVDALAASWYRVQLARRFHNEAVAQTQRVRRKVVVRALRLHGHAPLPHTVEIDDEMPDALRAIGAVG